MQKFFRFGEVKAPGKGNLGPTMQQEAVYGLVNKIPLQRSETQSLCEMGDEELMNEVEVLRIAD